MPKYAILLSTLIVTSPLAFTEQTTGEKTSSIINDAKRSVKKGGHRLKEALCAKGDAKCFAKKVKHRGEESVDYTKDTAQEAKDHVD